MEHDLFQLSHSSPDAGLSGQLLVAMPGMPDERFAKTVIYICAHNADGAMGLVINREIEDLSFDDLLDQMDIDQSIDSKDIPVQFGGPVESGRGFVLHTPDYQQENTMVVSGQIAVTATTDILRAIADGEGPSQCLLALGYAGWGPGQLDDEIKANGWLNVTADADLIFSPGMDEKWVRAMGKIGIDPRMLSDEAGHA